MAAEVLANSIRNCDDTKGIRVGDTEHKISQYADDTTLFVPFNISSVDTTFSLFERFQSVSGLKVNFDKTEIFPLGSLKDVTIDLYGKRNIRWSQSGVKVLGINITHSRQSLVQQNFNPILAKLQNIIKLWSARDLTIYRKVCIIKAHLQSQLVYQLSVLPTPPRDFLVKVEKLLFQFLWSNKPDKVKRNVLFGKKEEGGMNMPNIHLYYRTCH